MELPAKKFLATIGIVLLVIGIPTLLEELDLISASWLRIVPSLIVLVLGVSFLWATLSWRRKGERK